MTAKNDSDRNALIVCRLSLERCRHHLAHLRALMHLCQPSGLGLEPVAADSALDILTRMESELSRSAQMLDLRE